MVICRGKYFVQYPKKVLGKVEMRPNRYGATEAVIVGSLADALNAIQAPSPKEHRHAYFSNADAHASKQVENVPTNGQQASPTLFDSEPIINRNHKTISEKFDKAKLIPLADSIKKYNPKLSELQISVWVTYQSHRGFYDKSVIERSAWGRYLKPINWLDQLFERGCPDVACDGLEVMPSTLYYAGDIHKKIKNTIANEKTIVSRSNRNVFNAQLQRLYDTMPTPLKIQDEPENKLVLSPFSELVDSYIVNELADGTEANATIKKCFIKWLATLPSSSYSMRETLPNGAVRDLWSSESDVKNHWLDNVRFSQTTTKYERVRRKQAAQVIGAKLFDVFCVVALSAADKKKIEFVWNKTYNNYVGIDGDLVPVGFCINTTFKNKPLSIRPIQRNGVGFMGVHGTGIIAYDVGVGKTMTAILTLADMIAKGQCVRPLIVVPNQTYHKWIGEINGRIAERATIVDGKVVNKGEYIAHGILPQVKVNGYYNLNKQYLPLAVENVDDPETTKQVPRFSITVVTYEGLANMGFSEKTEHKLVQNVKEILSQGQSSKRQEATIEKKVEGMVDKSLMGSKLLIEKAGFDAIVVDEAHNFKNLFTEVRGEVQKSGKRDSTPYEITGGGMSARAVKLFMLNRYIHLKKGRRNTIGLTATPFTNSPLEIYSMQALFDYDGLRQHGINNIEIFFNQFIDQTYKRSWTNKGRFEIKAVVERFRNLQAMQQVIRKYIAFKTADEANVPRPNKIVLPIKYDRKGNLLPPSQHVETTLKPTNEQLFWLKEISKFCRKEESALDVHYADKVDDNGDIKGRVLIGLNAAQAVTMSPYLLTFMSEKHPPKTITTEQFMESSPKMRYVVNCIKSVKDWHEAHDTPVSGQVIYSNRGVKWFGHIKQAIIDATGFKDSEVQIISGGGGKDSDVKTTSPKKKEKIKEDFLAGKVKVIIGSATIREGIDLQDNASTLYNCYLDWNPTDLNQLNGRIWRYGNKYANVRIVVPLIENSFDIFLNQKLGEKTRRINYVWERAGRESVLKLDDFNPEELKYGLITDVDYLVDTIVNDKRNEIESGRKLIAQYKDQLTQAKSDIRKARKLKDYLIDVAQKSQQGNYGETVERLTKNRKITKDIRSVYRIVRICAKKQNEQFRTIMFSRIDEHIRLANILKRLDRDVLKKHGVGLLDDFNPLIASFARQIVQYDTELKDIASFSTRERLVKEYEAEREKTKTASESIEVRVNQFATMNDKMLSEMATL